MTNAVPYYLLACGTLDIELRDGQTDAHFSCPRCGATLLWVSHIGNMSVYRCLDHAAGASTRPISI